MIEKKHRISFFGILGILFLLVAITFYARNTIIEAKDFFDAAGDEGKTVFNVIYICISAILLPCILIGPFVKKIRRGMLMTEAILIIIMSIALIILGDKVIKKEDGILYQLIEVYIENIEWSIVAAVSALGCLVLDRIMVMNQTYDDAEERFDSDFRNIERMCEFCGRVLVGDEVCNCREAESETTEKSFCIYCGRVLRGNEKCSCGMAEAYAQEAEYKPPMPETPVKSEPVQTGFCTLCGAPLYNGEKCKCTEAVPATADVRPPVMPEERVSAAGTPIVPKEEAPKKPEPEVAPAGLKSTMRTKEKPALDYKDVENNEKGKAFLNKAGEL